jgi:hypothetical protein
MKATERGNVGVEREMGIFLRVVIHNVKSAVSLGTWKSGMGMQNIMGETK